MFTERAPLRFGTAGLTLQLIQLKKTVRAHNESLQIARLPLSLTAIQGNLTACALIASPFWKTRFFGYRLQPLKCVLSAG